MRDSLKRWPWYAAVLAAYPLLYIAVTNPGQVEAADVVPVVAAGILAAVLLVALVRPFAGTWAAAGLGAAWVILLFYLYGPANEWWLDWVRSGLEQQAAERTWYRAYPQLVHSAAWALIALAGIARLSRVAPRIPPALTGGLNVVAAVLLAFLGVQAARQPGAGRRPRSRAPDARARRRPRSPAAPTSISSCSTAMPGPTCSRSTTASTTGRSSTACASAGSR